MDALLSRSVAEPRFRTVILAAFAGLAWVLALVGVYGVVSYLVGQRTREIGIRMALGARRADVVRLVVAQGMRPVALGLAAGLGGAIPAARLVSSAVTGVQPFDAVTFAAVPAALLVAALAATFVPARRATRIAPMDVLR
jgi:ABC-type antimicrobial peptide transport system permease subunit